MNMNMNMNKKRIKYAISVMEKAKNLDMNSWQTSYNLAATITELHTCGNTACFAGYLALSPLFKEVGGAVGIVGEPVYEGLREESAVLAFFEMDEHYLPLLRALILGQVDGLNVGDEEFEQDLAEFSEFERKVVQQVTDLTGGISWVEWEPKHVITVLKAILNGEFDWLLED